MLPWRPESASVALILDSCGVERRVETFRADVLNAVYFRRGLTSVTCTIGLTNDWIDGGQPRAKNGF